MKTPRGPSKDLVREWPHKSYPDCARVEPCDDVEEGFRSEAGRTVGKVRERVRT